MKKFFEDEGELRDVDPLAGLVSAWREAADGALRFMRAGASAEFEIFQGEVVGVASSDPRFETSTILVRAGKLAPEALERLSAEPGSDLAAAALAAGVLTRREWRWGEKIRAIEVLSDLLTWPEGRYRFDRSVVTEPGEFRVPIPRLLLELFLRSRDRHLIEHQLGAPNAPLERGARFEDEFPGFGLTADAESVVQLIDGRSTAQQIAAKAPADEFAVQKLLAALVTLGLVQPAAAAVPVGEEGEPGLAAETGEAEAPEEVSRREAAPPVASAAPEWEGGDDEDLAREPGPPIEAPARAAGPEEPTPEPGSRLDRFAGEEPPPPALPAPEALPGDLWDELDLPTHPEAETAAAAAGLAEPRRGRGFAAAAWILGIAAAAVAGFLLVRGRDVSRVPASPVATPGSALTFPPPATAAPAASASRATAPPAAAPEATVPPVAAAAPATATRPRAATARPTGSTVPTVERRATPPRGEGREVWVRRAQREERRLSSDRKTRYAIQLELVCETASLSEAWKHDRRSSMWLLASPHGGRDCFRVLWGRFGSLDAAKRAKSGIPPYFLTRTNRPAVVAVR